MADIVTLHRELQEEGHYEALARNPRIGFGTGTRQYLGAQFLPERPTDSNEFSELDLQFESAPANDATRYSEPQMKRASRGALAEGKYGEIDIASELTGRDFDNIRKVAINNPDQAKAQLIAWHNRALNLSVVEKEEIQRWQVIIDAQVQILGTDGKISTLSFNNPLGHRITIPSGTTAAPAGWYGAVEDPMDAIFAIKTEINNKGYEVSRLIGDSTITNVLATNPVMQSRLGTLTISGNTLTSRQGLVSRDAISAYFNTFGLPPLEEYNLTFRDQLRSGFFKKRGTLAFIATTGRSEDVFLGDETITIENTLGYYGIGLAVGENNPGRVIRSESRNLKPVGIYGQGFQTSVPVLLASEAIGVITIPEPVAA